MKQLVLPLVPPPEPSLDNFFAGRNAELLSALRALASDALPDRVVYLWGESGSGRSHLLRALALALTARGVPLLQVGAVAAWPRAGEEIRALLVDDVDRLDASAQAEFFGLYNRLREHQGIVLAAGAAPPARLGLRADLVTRLGWGLIYQVFALSDEEKKLALKQHARARACDVPDEVLDYLLRHLRRDLPTLIGVVDALDRLSLETRRAVTLPLLRHLLRSGETPVPRS